MPQNLPRTFVNLCICVDWVRFHFECFKYFVIFRQIIYRLCWGMDIKTCAGIFRSLSRSSWYSLKIFKAEHENFFNNLIEYCTIELAIERWVKTDFFFHCWRKCKCWMQVCLKRYKAAIFDIPFVIKFTFVVSCECHCFSLFLSSYLVFFFL